MQTFKKPSKYRHLPNILSFSRLIVSPLLIPCFNKPGLYAAVFLFCGLSDILDGFLARKLGAESSRGARLDSLGDLIMFVSILLSFLLQVPEILQTYIPAIGIIFLIKLAALLLGSLKNKEFYSLHTLGNKLAGFLVLYGLGFFYVFRSPFLFWFILATCFLSAIEEFLIFLTRKKPDKNIKSIFLK